MSFFSLNDDNTAKWGGCFVPFRFVTAEIWPSEFSGGKAVEIVFLLLARDFLLFIESCVKESIPDTC